LRPSEAGRLFCRSRYFGAPPFSGELKNLGDLLADNFSLSEARPDAYFLALDHDSNALRVAKKAGIPKGRRYLVVREPKQVHPFPHSRGARREYGTIFFLGFPVQGQLYFPWPFVPPAGQVSAALEPKRKNGAVAVASWRVSFIRGSLYTLRARAFKDLDVDVYGRGWTDRWRTKSHEMAGNIALALRWPGSLLISMGQIFARPTKYLGEASDKYEVLRGYKISLVVENSTDYSSEKLLDALFCGTIPVYCGADPGLLGIPEGLVVTCEPSLEALERGLIIAASMNYEQWRERADAWIEETLSHKVLLSEGVWKNIVSELLETARREHF
jgi:hypothetical protein